MNGGERGKITAAPAAPTGSDNNMTDALGNGSLGGGDSEEIKRLAALSGTFKTWGERPKSRNTTRSLFFRGLERPRPWHRINVCSA